MYKKSMNIKEYNKVKSLIIKNTVIIYKRNMGYLKQIILLQIEVPFKESKELKMVLLFIT